MREPPLAALWIYGYSCGAGSARALERMQHHGPGLRWLCADEVVNHQTLPDFRTSGSGALEELFAQVLAAMQAYLARMESEEGKQTYKERSRLGEFAQLQLKAVRGLTRFRLKGPQKVRQEAMLWAIACNVAQWIRLAWGKASELAARPALAAS